MINSQKAPQTARRAAVTAAARLMRSTSHHPRELVVDMLVVGSVVDNGHNDSSTNSMSSAGFIFSTVSPSCMISPECMSCGESLTWLEIANGRHRLPLGRCGFYGLCSTCTSKNDAEINKIL
jgi:hypothetical protein